MVFGPVNGVMSELTYDCRNRLVSAGGLTYGYDAENNRISITNDKTTTYFAYDTVALVSRILTAETGDKTVYYVYGTGLVSQEDDENILYYHFNNLGSTQALTNLDGEVVDTFEYGPYGELTSANKYGVMFLYNGEYGVATDANGLYYMRARYYNPEIKRFINQDIVIGDIINTPSMNRYAYVQGNPISYVDPFGLSPGLGWKFWGHLALSALGMLTLIPTPITFAIGAIANLANGIWYAAEGDWFNAACCAVSILGGAFKMFDVAGKAGKLNDIGCTIHKVLKYSSCIGDIALGAYDMYRVGTNIYDKAARGELTFKDIAGAGFQIVMDSVQIAGGIEGLGNKVSYCFVEGTPVETDDGQKPIEEFDLSAYMLIISILTTLTIKGFVMLVAGFAADFIIAGSFILAAVAIVVLAVGMYILFSGYEKQVDLYCKAMYEGDEEAATMLSFNAFMKCWFKGCFSSLKYFFSEMFS